MCEALCDFVHVALCNEPHNQKTLLYHCHWTLSCYSFVVIPIPPPPSLIPSKLLICPSSLYFCYFMGVTKVELYSMYPLKTGCFFTRHNFLKVHLSCTRHYFIPFERWVVVHGMDIPRFVGQFTY